MLFDDEARTKLDAIVHGAAVGETVGLLASRMSEAERAERLTPEGILQLSRQPDLTSTSAEMLKATIKGLEAADAVGSPSNLDIRIHLHRAYREWATTSPLASEFRNTGMTQTILSGRLGSFASTERGGCDGMLSVAPVGLAFVDDPGRAFQIGAEAGALLDADFNGYLAAGVVSLLFALVEQGMSVRASIADVLSFIRPLDWCGEVSGVLSAVTHEIEMPGYSTHLACGTLRTALIALLTSSPMSEVLRGDAISRSSSSALNVVAQLHMRQAHTEWFPR